ncbi:MFS transporter [Pseudoroseicyclus sp. H15]
MSISANPQQDDRAARRNVMVLVAAQALIGAQMPMLFTIGGLAGQMLAPNACLATLPISLIVFGSMTTAPWISPFMAKAGRRAGFMIGCLAGALGALLGAWAISIGSFPLLLAGSYLTGIYMSAQGFFRFAATDRASDAYRPKAISYVMAGGLIAALVGPQLVKVTAEATAIPFIGTYLVAALLNLLGLGLIALLDLPPQAPVPGASRGRSMREILRSPPIVVAIICGMVSYTLMNLVMTSTPLAVVGCGFSRNTAADVVSAHVLAMYVPSFFTGALIARFGTTRIMGIGLAILAAAGVTGLAGVELANFYGALVLLGIGWNFGFIGATTMLAAHHTPEERGRVQGLNDAIVFGCVTLGSLASGGLMNCSGGDVVQGWNAVNLAMIPLLALAGGALIWLVMRPKEA